MSNNLRYVRAIVGCALAGALTISAAQLAEAAPANSNTGSIGSLSTQAIIPAYGPITTDAQLDALLARLESLPDNIKNVNPQRIPDFTAKLQNYLAGGTFSVATVGIRPNTDWFRCITSIAGLIGSIGFPAARIVSWIQRARAIYGGIRGIAFAISTGEAVATIGQDAVNVLGKILGIGAIVDYCFN